jgi:hypothetical protein
MAGTRREIDLSNIIREKQIAVERAYKDVGAGKPKAMDAYNRANSALAAANYRLYQVSAGLATDID